MAWSSNSILVVLEVLTVASAILVTFHPNILYASLALLMTFLGVAGLFVFAGADFLAAAQCIVYVGGVTILILFAIMLTQWLYQMKLRDFKIKLILPMILGFLLVFPIVFGTLSRLGKWIVQNPLAETDTFSALPKTQLLGEALLGAYVLPFEAVTILLLGALVGAVWLARPR